MPQGRIRIHAVSWHSRRDAVEMLPNDDQAMISITEPNDAAPLKKGWKNLLRLEFHDFDAIPEDSDEYNYVLFDQDLASETIEFLDRIQGEVSHIHVHCFAGISRSAAVARFIADRYGLPFNREYEKFNRLVNRILSAEDARRASFFPVEDDMDFKESFHND